MSQKYSICHLPGFINAEIKNIPFIPSRVVKKKNVDLNLSLSLTIAPKNNYIQACIILWLLLALYFSNTQELKFL